MEKLNYIHIENFRIHKNTKVNKIGSFLSLVGKNNIGKTSILDAIGIAFNKINIEKDDFMEGHDNISIQTNFGQKTYKNDGTNTGEEQGCPEFFLFKASEQYQDEEINDYSIDEFIATIENQIKRYAKYNVIFDYGDEADRNVDDDIIEHEINIERKNLIKSLECFVAAKRLKEFLLLTSKKYFNDKISNSFCFDDYYFVAKEIKVFFNQWIDDKTNKDELKADFNLLQECHGATISGPYEFMMREINGKRISDISKINNFDDIDNVIKQRDKIIEVFDRTIKPNSVVFKLLNKWKELITDFKLNNDNIKIGKHGSGVRRICAIYNHIIQSIMSVKNNTYIFAIDEPEISLHPEQQRKFIKILKDVSKDFKNIQIIIATHSPYIVNELDTKEIYILKHKTKKGKEGNIIELPEIQANPLKNRVLKYYKSMAEINYLAFGEVSKDYHIELFGYIQNRLSFKYENELSFQTDWHLLRINDLVGNSIPHNRSKWEKYINGVSGVDAWLVNANGITNFKTNIDAKFRWYDTRAIEDPTYNGEKRTLPYCVRNNIDHPLLRQPRRVTVDLFKKAKKNNAKYNDLELIRESIEIMRKVIIDNKL